MNQEFFADDREVTALHYEGEKSRGLFSNVRNSQPYQPLTRNTDRQEENNES